MSEYTIGIDLGTSNCAVAFASLNGSSAVKDFLLSQIERPGEIREEPLLPSALYAPFAEEKAPLALPWSRNGDWVIGRYSRSRGAKVPGRVITSAKSWLCHPSVDRTAPILPWGAGTEVPKLSPVTASALLLAHIRDAWDRAHPSAPLTDQEVVITVPASFDEAARALTVSAARAADIEQFTLLEEPQAAFYDFSHRHAAHLADLLSNIRLVLVVDVGGGTTDFTLVQVAASPEGPLLKRIAVGDHLILGGDNMDNALARRVEEKLAGKKLSAAQWIQVVQAAREVKELLFAENAPREVKIAIASEGSRLIGSVVTTALSGDEVRELVIDGFFPSVLSSERPKKNARAGIQEMGLPYVPDPAIPRHLAAFLQKHAVAAFEALGVAGGVEGVPRPDAILLNGGVFNSRMLANRVVDIVSAWWPERERIPILDHDSLDLAVARGAACYGLVRHGRGRKISGGAAHSFYVGVVADSGDSQDAAVCLLPRGVEEGDVVELKERIFKLHVGRPVQFPIYTSTADRVDRSGDIIRVTPEMTSLPAIQTVLKSPRERSERIPVYLRARLTEIGTVEIWCVSAESKEEWRLEFDIRGDASSRTTITESLPVRFSEAKDYIAKIYGHRPGSVEKGPRDVKQLWNSLEKLLGPRESWNVALLRQIWGELFAGATKRRRSAEHERIYFQLLGYSLRPGFGYSLDEWRSEQTFKLFTESVEFHKEKANWNEFWILWRRISGGLSAQRQNEFWQFARPHLYARIPLSPSRDPSNPKVPKGPKPEGIEELVRAAASMEHLPLEEKTFLGELICTRVGDTQSAGGPWAWSLGRIASRILVYGSAHNVVTSDIAARWINCLSARGLKKADGTAFAAAQMARRTGDRLRDLDDTTRSTLIQNLQSVEGSDPWIQMVSEFSELKTSDAARVLGDSLPMGLQLTQEIVPARDGD